MNAYVLIDSLPKLAHKIANNLRNKDGVLIADVINGPHNVMAVLQGIDIDVLAKMVIFEIREMDGVKDVTVYMASDIEGTQKCKP